MRWLLAVPIYLVMAVAYAHAPQGTQLSAREVADKASAESKAQQLIQWQVDGSIRMTAPMQDMQAIISPHGITLHSVDEAGDAAFGWRLTQLGRETGLVPVSERGSVGRRGDVVVLLRQEVIEEYRASAEGIRQDFVLPRKPVGDGALTLELAVQGAELAALDDGGSGDIARHTINDQAIGITMADGRELHYHALHVTDADGRHLPAQMHVADAGRLRITVDDAQARYPLRIDPTFTDADWMAIAEPGFNGPIYAAVVGGGNLYVGGGFTAANGGVLANYIAVWNGSAWSTLGSGMNHLVHALVWDGTAQRLYAGGYFTTAGGTPASRIAVWDGSAWSALGSGLSNYVNALAWDGAAQRLYAGGRFTTAGGTAVDNIAVWNGSAWSALAAGVNNEVRALAWDGATQRLYVGGRFTTAGGIPASHFAAWNGSTWLVLGSGINGPVFALLWDGVAQRLYAGGSFTAAGGTSAKNIAVWNGSAWSALGSGLGNLGNYVNALAWDGAAQRLYAGGDFVSWVGGAEVNNIAVWNGSAWSALGSGLNNEVLALAWDGAAQRLYAGGKFRAAGDTGADNIAAWDGSVWSTLGSSMNSEVHALVWDGAAQRLYAGGFFSTAGGTAADRIAVWNGIAWSALGSGMGTGTNDYVYALAWDGAAQRLYAGGRFTTAGGTSAKSIAVWNGSAWSALGSGMNNLVSALAWDGAAQRLYAGGYFTEAGGTSANRIAVWNGSEWSALGSGMDATVAALAWDGAAQRLYAGGFFSTAGGTAADRIAVWNGIAWSALGSGMGTGTNDYVYALAWDGAAQRLYAGGRFTTAGGTSAKSIAVWNGSAWSALGSGMNNLVSALAWDGAAQRLYAGGYFTEAGGTSAKNIAVWDGSAWSALGSGMNGTVAALAWDGAAQRLYAGGYFTMAGDKPAAIAYAQFETPQAPLNVIATPASILFGETSTLSTSGGSGSGTVSYAVTAGDTFCEVGGATLTGKGLGTCTVTATKEASANYLQATATVEVTITPKVDLEIAKDANRTTAQIGDTVVYSIVVANIGPNDVAGAGISDNPPATLTDVEWACVPPPVSSVVCPPAPHDAGTGPMNVLIDLAANGYLRYDLSGVVQGVIGAQIDNTASVAVPEGITDPEDGNDSASASVLIVPVGLFADGFESVGKPMAVPAAEKTRIRPRE